MMSLFHRLFKFSRFLFCSGQPIVKNAKVCTMRKFPAIYTVASAYPTTFATAGIQLYNVMYCSHVATVEVAKGKKKTCLTCIATKILRGSHVIL